MDLYSGPEYVVHFKYSSVFVVTFVTMMYGVGMPILFPIACLNYFMLWCGERYWVAYTYQLPPSLDDKLTKNAMEVLRYAPLFFLFNGYWMLSNLQIFQGEVQVRLTSDTLMNTGHTFSSIVSVNQSSPVIFIALMALFIFVMQKFFKKSLKKYGFGFSASKIEVDEDLPNFFNAIKQSEKEWIYAEALHYKKFYNI